MQIISYLSWWEIVFVANTINTQITADVKISTDLGGSIQILVDLHIICQQIFVDLEISQYSVFLFRYLFAKTIYSKIVYFLHPTSWKNEFWTKLSLNAVQCRGWVVRNRKLTFYHSLPFHCLQFCISKPVKYISESQFWNTGQNCAQK